MNFRGHFGLNEKIYFSPQILILCQKKPFIWYTEKAINGCKGVLEVILGKKKKNKNVCFFPVNSYSLSKYLSFNMLESMGQKNSFVPQMWPLIKLENYENPNIPTVHI